MVNDSFYRAVAENAPVLIWMSGPDNLRIYVNRHWLEFTGRPVELELGDGWTRGVHRDDLEHCLSVYSESFDHRQELRLEYRLQRHDGAFRWVRDHGVPQFEADGSFTGYIGTCFDITESKVALDSLLQGNARLVEAQDQERARIAQELHDDIGSSLAILGIELLRAGQPVSGVPGQRHPGIPEIYRKLQQLSSRVSRISHQVHPPALEYIGLANAIEGECRKFSEQYHLPISCVCTDLPAKLDTVVSLSFLRVVQEALHNAVKHSQATGVTVRVVTESNLIALEVSDNGIGFDVEQSRLARGIGLISMRERMRLIGGAFEIWSEPGKGAKIQCRAPMVRSESTET